MEEKNSINQLGSFMEKIGKITLDLPKLEIPKLDIPKFDYNYSSILETTEIPIIENPLIGLAEQNNEYLKDLVEYNESISNYNRQLVSLNEKILSKINSLDDTLLFLSNSFDKKAYVEKDLGQEHNALLLELITIIESKDKTKLQTFMSGIAGPVSVGLVIEYLKIKLGFTGK